MPRNTDPSIEPLRPLTLIVELCRALDDAGVRYCHWKSNEAIDRSATAENDLDLLVDRAHVDQFDEILHRLQFKQARPSTSREVPGLIDYYGLDPESGRLVHLQAHYQLVLGDDMTKNFRLPVESEYLAGSRSNGLFQLPAPDFELALFVVRMVLKHASWDAQASLLGRLSASEQRELAYLFARVRPQDRAPAMAEHLPFLSDDLIQRCLRAVEPGTPRRARAGTARALEHQLESYARRRPTTDVMLRTVRRGARLAAHALHRPARKQLVSGGSLIGVVGPDSSATSVVVESLVGWLGAAFPVRRYDLTSEFDGPSDRLLAEARRYSTNGGIAICELVSATVGKERGDGDGARDSADSQSGGAPTHDLLLVLDPSPPVKNLSSIRNIDPTCSADEILARAREVIWEHL